MLNFKKGSIFSRSAENEDADEEYEEEQSGVLAVWGSPGSGKTTAAARIAKHLAGKRRNTILLLCDMSAPMLPCICPPKDLENKGSLGSVLAKYFCPSNHNPISPTSSAASKISPSFDRYVQVYTIMAASSISLLCTPGIFLYLILRDDFMSLSLKPLQPSASQKQIQEDHRADTPG